MEAEGRSPYTCAERFTDPAAISADPAWLTAVVCRVFSPPGRRSVMLAVPAAPAWLQRAVLGADAMGTGPGSGGERGR